MDTDRQTNKNFKIIIFRCMYRYTSILQTHTLTLFISLDFESTHLKSSIIYVGNCYTIHWYN